MSSTPPPPPHPVPSSSPPSSAQPHGRPSGAPYRGGTGAPYRGGTGAPNASRPRPSPQQRALAPQRIANPSFTYSGGYGGPAPSVAGTGTASVNSGNSAAAVRTTATTSAAHMDPAARLGVTDASQTAATTRRQLPAQAEAAPASSVSPELLRSLTAAVHECIAGYLYQDAIELAQQLFNLDATYRHLHLLAHCYTLSGAIATAYRLLHHHYPFFEVHVTRPRTAAATHSPGGVGVAFTVFDGAALPLDARRTWSSTAPSNAPGITTMLSHLDHGEIVDLSYETVDLKAQWDCQYLLGVCCYRTQHYEDGVKVLSQLLYVKYQLDTAGAALRRQQQAPSQLRSADVERQLRSYAFATEARVSQVLYWLGLCEKHRQRPPLALDYLRRSFSGHPTRLDAFQEYIRLAWPLEAAVEDLLAVKESLAEEDEDGDGACVKESLAGEDTSTSVPQQRQRPPQRRGRDAPHAGREDDEEEHTPSTRTDSPRTAGLRCRGATRPPASTDSPAQSVTAGCTCGSKTSAQPVFSLDAPPLTAAQRRCVQQHLQPYLWANFLCTTYRCPEAVDALQGLLQQQQQAASSAASGASSSVCPGGRPSSIAHAPFMQAYGRAQPSHGQAAARGRVCPVSGVPLSLSPLLLRQLALAQFHNGDVQESAETFDRLLRVAPWELTSTALIYYSTALWHLKSEGALGSLAQRLTDAEPFSPTTFCVVANAYSLVKDARDALVMLKRAVQLAPTLAYAYALYGYELLGQGNKAEAERAFKTALAVDQTLYIAYAGLGERFIREEQVDRARGYYKQAAKINPTPAIMNRFALTYHRQNNSLADLKWALRLYSESLQRHPNNLTARRQRTDVLLRLDRPKEALEELKALLVQCPGEAALYMTLAECMVCLKRPQEALQHYQTAMHLDPRRESYVQGCIDRLVAVNML
ncbi:hypothetical protein ABL78_7300 [Leptomonas seymouri]|uniref:Bacterial transcriptional activator domain-containing protein n=1 Tax=Leptomonas seymouri TaxID=5684 RepID=A0A0N1HU62_LEPSE|nr:hypothetical protein ABL78_7300 [Leptomonas seymouri]|eukprot:KPI83661.1 hypothetical protein ABL78_7300 [Leptomonas seymouri]